MANIAICAEITGEVDLSCVRTLPKKYFQEVVVINFNDIDRAASTVNATDASCDYSVSLVLKEGKKGVMIKLPESGGTIKGTYAKTTSDLGFPQYQHVVNILLAGITAEIKCKLDKLDRGKYVIATQLADGTVEIWGYENGLGTGDYTWDIVEGGGATVIPMQSREGEEESMISLLYKAAVPGGENADFNEQFAQPAANGTGQD
mgnify:CR=1 FL=1